jgi:hypothetical protein
VEAHPISSIDLSKINLPVENRVRFIGIESYRQCLCIRSFDYEPMMVLRDEMKWVRNTVKREASELQAASLRLCGFGEYPMLRGR